MKWELNDYNIKKFIFLLRRYLKQYGYTSRISLEDFSIAMERTEISNQSMDLEYLVKEIHSYLEKFTKPSRDFIFWKQNIDLSFSRNVRGYNMLNKLVNRIESFKDSIDYEKIKFLRINKNELLYLRFELGYRIKYGIPELHIENLDEFLKLISFFDDNNDNSWWFRGHSNKNWDLIPTFLRNVDRTSTHIIDYNELKNIYSNFGLTKKYNSIFGKSILDYDMLAYMQHSTSYSPMIDFTTKFLVAVSFALSNKSNVNDFHNIDSSIICIDNRSKTKIESRINNYKVGLLADRKWTVSDIITIYGGMGTIFKAFADVSYSTNRTNDRMKYQQGIFMMYDNFISYPTHPVPIDVSSKIVKIVIDKNIKEILYKYLYDNKNEFRQYFLMNPYQYLAE